jgi:hypothetical protein
MPKFACFAQPFYGGALRRKSERSLMFVRIFTGSRLFPSGELLMVILILIETLDGGPSILQPRGSNAL